jgi:hypothetical protein
MPTRRHRYVSIFYYVRESYEHPAWEPKGVCLVLHDQMARRRHHWWQETWIPAAADHQGPSSVGTGFEMAV